MQAEPRQQSRVAGAGAAASDSRLMGNSMNFIKLRIWLLARFNPFIINRKSLVVITQILNVE